MCANGCSENSRPHRRVRVWLLVSLAMLATVTGCVTQKSILLPELDSWQRRVIVLAAVDNWDFNGRIAVKTDNDGFNGKLRWQQRGDSFKATVSGPLGIGTVRIEADGAAIVLTDKDGVRTRLDDAELELRFRYGWTIPVTSLRYWALGIPDPELPYDTEFDASGQLVVLDQRDWHVNISRYRDGGGQQMPGRLSATNADTRVRLAIDDWLFLDQ